jgi:hypothetical protein
VLLSGLRVTRRLGATFRNRRFPGGILSAPRFPDPGFHQRNRPHQSDPSMGDWCVPATRHAGRRAEAAARSLAASELVPGTNLKAL